MAMLIYTLFSDSSGRDFSDFLLFPDILIFNVAIPLPPCSRICTQVPGEWQERTSETESSLLPLVHSIVVYCLDHSSESEAVDLLMEIDHVTLLKELVKEDTYQRVCLYLTR